MKYFDAVFQYNPSGVWKLDGDYNDSSGLGNNGSLLSGSLVTLLPTSYGSVSSMRIGNGTVVRVPSVAYSSSKGVMPFSIVANFFPIAASTETGLVTHDTNLDGLTFDSTNVYFTVKSTTTTYRVSAPLIMGAQQVIGVYDGSTIALYQNGVRVSYTEAVISTYQSFTNPTFLYCGQGTSTAGLDNVVTYSYALNQEQIQNLYNAMVDHQDEKNAYGAYATQYINLADPVAMTHISREWSGDDWKDAFYTTVNVDETGVVVETAGGTWTTSVMLADLTTTTISSAIINWTGSNITVETSFDNATWTAATNGGVIAGITYPYDVTSKVLFIRVTFAALGTLTALSFKCFTSFSFVSSDNNRVVTHKGSVEDATSNFIPGQTDSIGARLFPGSIKIAADVGAAPTSVYGLEFMFKIPVGSASFTLFSNAAGTVTVAFTNTGTITVTGASAAVLNGSTITVGAATSIVQGAWMHLAITFTAANVDLYFGTNNTNTQTNTFRLSRPVLFIETVNAAALQDCFNNLFSRVSTQSVVATLGISQTPVHTTYNSAWTSV